MCYLMARATAFKNRRFRSFTLQNTFAL